MSFHTCMVTGSENVYTGYGLGDPCGEEEKDCHETSTHFEQADCCDLDQTIVSVDDKINISFQKIPGSVPLIIYTLIPSYLNANHSSTHSFYYSGYFVKPPGLIDICVFRI